MKAVVCTKPQDLQIVDRPKPTLPPGHALVRIQRVGICGTDFHAFQGNQPYLTYPRILGHELSGTIETVDAANPRALEPDDRVAIIPYLHCGQCIACRRGKPNCCTHLEVLGVHRDGGMQEYLPVPWDHLVKVPDLSLDQAAILEPLSIGAHAVRRSKVDSGDLVLVIGAGPIGLAVMAFAHHRGARVITMDIDERRLAFAQSWCPLEAVLHAEDRPEDRLAAITQGDYPTAVFDATGNIQSMRRSLYYVAHGGTLVFVGLSQDAIQMPDPEFHKREVTLMGSRNATLEDFATVRQAILDQSVSTHSYITATVPLGEIIHEFQRLVDGQTHMIKTLITL